MKKYILLFVVLVYCLITTSCGYMGPGAGDFSYDLSRGYRIDKDGGAVTGGAQIWKNDDNQERIVIEKDVTKIAWDENFILAEQKELNKNDNINYWIIDVKQDKIYNNLNKNEFNAKRKELNINKDLKLDNPEKYKK